MESMKYDVFLSFRGPDTRNNFTDHLHKALNEASIKTFLDANSMELGLEINQELRNAIKASRSSIIVLSKDYASSRSCLEELRLILDQNTSYNHFVLPIFYHVQPNDLRNKKSSFGVSIDEHRKKMEEETNAEIRNNLDNKIDLWWKALKQVSRMYGKDAKGRLETDFIDEIISAIHSQLGWLLGPNPKVLIGMESHINSITSWLKDDESIHNWDILTIFGMGGIGKTSLAKLIFKEHCRLFKRSSFIADIKSRTILDLQKQLVSNISRPSSVQVYDDSEYTSNIENALKCKKVLLVLDDVDDVDQLNNLLGKVGCYPGSKIIITTQDVSSINQFRPHNSTFQVRNTVHVLKGLDDESSRELLSFHAQTRDKEGYNEVSKKVLKYCEGHPGALEKMGRSLCDKGVNLWEEYIHLFSTEMNLLIKKVLRMDVSSLPTQNDKDLFKDIASFFAGKDRVFAETILNACKTKTTIGIDNLTERCLLTIGSRNELRMHKLIQEMGRDEIRKESPNPWERSRLWCHKESFNALLRKRGKKNLQGIVPEEPYESLELETDRLREMEMLKLLQLNHVQFKGSYEKFPKNIIWLCLHGFLSPSLPLDLPMANLVVLDMSYSSIESFDMTKSPIQNTGSSSEKKLLLRSLKILNLSFCNKLSSVGGFSHLPMLERLILASCKGLNKISKSIKLCRKLVVIDLSYCNRLRKLPSSLYKLKNLEAVSLDGCNLGDVPIITSDDDLKNLLHGNMSESLANLLPPRRDKNWNESFSMESISISENTVLDGDPTYNLPNCVESLCRMEERARLMSIEHPQYPLRPPKSRRRELLQKMVFDPKMTPLAIALTIYLLAHSSIEIEGIVKIEPISDVEEKVLRRLGWNHLDSIKYQEVETWHDWIKKKKSQVKLFFEFGIFSTFYGGKQIPKWIKIRKNGRSITFTVPSNLRGLNFCYVQKGQDSDDGVNLLTVKVENQTKMRTWIYKHYIHWVKVDEKCLIWLSHWMFGKNEMEKDNQVTISIQEEDLSNGVHITKCGVSFVIDDEEMKKDPLVTYKSWNHRIGGDLSDFRLTTGEYFLDNHRVFFWHIDCPVNRPFIVNGSCYEEKEVDFRASCDTESSHIVDDTTEVQNKGKRKVEGNKCKKKRKRARHE